MSNKNVDGLLLAMAGQCAIERINEEVDAALKDLDWTPLAGISLDDWFEAAVKSHTQEKRPTKRSLPRRILRYAASILLFVFVASSLVIAAYEPARAAFIRFIVERLPQYSEYFIRPDADGAETEMTYAEPGYIPEGFKLAQSQDAPDSRFMSWENESTGQYIAYYQTRGDSTLMLDTENAIVRQAVIQGLSAEVIEKDRVTTVQFFLDDVCYAVVTNLPQQECIHIAQSIAIQV